LNISETGGVTTTPRKVERHLRHQRKLSLAIEMLIHCIARTGLPFAGSTRLLAAACLGKFTVSALDHLKDFFGPHNVHLYFGYFL